MELKKELVRFALLPGANMRELCRRYEISVGTGYKWLHRYLNEGDAGLEDRSLRAWAPVSITLGRWGNSGAFITRFS
jgi:transposase-like protein